MASFSVKVTPNARKSAFTDCRAGVYQIRLAAPPVDGKANKALIDFLADVLGVKKSQVSIVRGEKNRQKVIEVSSLSEIELLEKLETILRPDE